MNEITTDYFNLPKLNQDKREDFIFFAEQVLSTQQLMQNESGKNIIHYTLKDQEQHFRMQHYPKGDRIDKKTGAQYFYHCHREDYEQEEHGHFHCFLRYKHIPPNIKPRKLVDWDKFIKNPMTHIITIGMNRYGQPIRLFTVNRWVTSEISYDAKHTAEFINLFNMTKQDDKYWTVLDKWVEGMLKIFSPQITWLNYQRDIFLSENANINPFNNKELEELSSIKIDLKKQIEWIIG